MPSGTFKYLTVSACFFNFFINNLIIFLQDLKSLNLADNSLPDLGTKVFQMLTKLKNLDLSLNPLEDLPPDVFKDVIVSMMARAQNELYIWQFKMMPEMSQGRGI